MPNPNRRYSINFNLVLDDSTDAMLCKIAADTHLSKAHVVRSCLTDAYAMRYQRKPMCADGQLCRCPHAHIYTPADLPSDPPGDSDG